ncbi:GntR family transcriptional regulator [Paenibacillus bovis]|uniref:GntR family transcriptional regulator n=1 Tax=Paenibacillus bovis TaxID=1616788 RepID=A0A172ZMC6_9BACL|nr:GntR family transcriptional regulator [Paenibacillus bovis]ANF98804.1 GntR family transcriptional regulator [Paenibacillus bovis]
MNTTKFQKLSRPSLRDQVYSTIKQGIITLELAPGQKLNDMELANQFGVSRTPVREALKRLEDEGLVESFPGSITRIALLHEETAAHAFVVVAVLHALAAKLCVSKLTESDYAELEAANQELIEALEQQDAEKAITADDRFHQLFLDRAANPELNAALDGIMPKIRRLEYAKFSQASREHSPADHLKIIAYCREHNEAEAARWMEHNWLSLGQWLAHRQDDVSATSNSSKAAEEL